MPPAKNDEADEERPRRGRRRPHAQPPRYRGKVRAASPRTLNMDWNTWPGSPSFGAMMQELTRFAVSGRLREQPDRGRRHAGGVPPGRRRAGRQRVHCPAQERRRSQTARTQGADDVQRLPLDRHRPERHLSHDRRPGSAGVPVRRQRACHHGRTSASSESDLAPRWTSDELQDRLPRLGFPARRTTSARCSTSGGPVTERCGRRCQACIGPGHRALPASGRPGAAAARRWCWPGRSATTRAVAGTATAEPPRTGAAWPAVVAGRGRRCLCLIAAGVLIHAGRTGDFLGFLPEAFRGWVEGCARRAAAGSRRGHALEPGVHALPARRRQRPLAGRRHRPGRRRLVCRRLPRSRREPRPRRTRCCWAACASS